MKVILLTAILTDIIILVKILGIDPGLTKCGTGVITSTGNKNVLFEKAYLIKTSFDQTLDDRLKIIGENIIKIIKKHKPDILVCEKVFAQENRASIISVAQVSGAVIYIGSVFGLKVGTHTPTEIKSSITGNGRASKKQVQYMVQKILKLPVELKQADIADSLAVAICHAWNPASITVDNSLSKTPAQQQWIEAIKTTRKKGYFNR